MRLPLTDERREAYRRILEQIPVTVNDCYGDPLYGPQFDNTLYKLNTLRARLGSATVITKGVINRSMSHRLTKVVGPRAVFVYSLTGLDEGGISFQRRVDTLRMLREITHRICVIIRPVIPGRNDTGEILERILNVAHELEAVVAYGGYKEVGNLKRKYSSYPEHKYLAPDVEKFIADLASRLNLRAFKKSGCAVAHLAEHRCFIHTTPSGNLQTRLELLNELGYQFTAHGSGIVMEKGTAGDANFIRTITGIEPQINDFIPNSAILGFSHDQKTFENTSSYFVWSRNLNKCIGCDYCCIQDFPHLWGHNNKEIGCPPEHIFEFI